MICPSRREPARASTLVELLVATVIGGLVLGGTFMMYRFSRTSSEQTLAPQMSLQMNSRRALLELIKEIQESIEVVRPAQGSSLSYFLIRDKLNRILVGYLVKNDRASQSAGRDLFDFILVRKGFDRPPDRKTVLSGVERLLFTSFSPGVIQIHADLHEAERSYSFLTAVRSRNVYADADL